MTRSETMEHVEVLRRMRNEWPLATDEGPALDAAIASLSAPKSRDAESKLAEAGVFAGHHGLRGLADAAEFWEKQPYGTRLYYGDGGMDYLHRGVLQTAVEILDAAPQPPAEAHCTTCSCVPGMTPAVRFDATPAEKDGAVRDHLIRMGWTPPAEAQPVAWRFWAPEVLGTPYKEWTGWSTDEGFRKHAESRGWVAEYAYRSDAPSAPLGRDGAVAALRVLSDFNPGADEFTNALSCLWAYFDQAAQSDQMNDLSDALELPDGFRVVEHLPGIWEYQFDIEDESDEDSDRMCSGASWCHPAFAAIAAWQHAYDEAKAPPPSAPVGVEEILAEMHEEGQADIVDGGIVLEWVDNLRNALATQPKVPTWIGIDWAEGQQPAAVDGDKPYPAPRNRQEAAALAKLALAYLGVTSAHIDAVVTRCETDLAAQQGGSDNDR